MAISAETASMSSSSAISPWKYHVFLSFRGADTRTGFTDHLHAALKQRSIETFIDDDELERGEIISDQLLQAIDKSLISLMILSEKYASSRWCLDELQRILESKKCLGREVIPVFYKIDPSHVRYQGGAFAHAFQKHVERYDPKKVQGWRDALKEIEDISGYHSLNRHESKLIEEIVIQFWTKLQPRQPYDKNEFVGIKSTTDKLSSIFRIGLDDVRLLGIWGMGGLGKTSLARAIYQRIQSQFDASYFYANVREISKKKGLVHLQRKFLSCSLQLRNKEFDHIDDEYEGKNMIKTFLCNQKVLMVLDDVSEMSQLEFLAAKKDWLGPGSRVIVTTRDKKLLTVHGEFETYVADFLNDEESLQLLCQSAFKSDQPPVDYLELSKSVVEQAAVLPLTLKMLGCHLCGRNMLEWKDVLGKMKKVLPNDIMKGLQISYVDIHPNELVELKMQCSNTVQLWNDTLMFEKLKFMDLSHSEDLIYTPNFSMLPNLERLILEGFVKLVKVHPSLGQHKKINIVSLKDCKNLKALPSRLEMDSLRKLILSGCSKFRKLPEFGENMEYLSIIELKDCKNLACLPDSISNLKSLRSLNIDGCAKFQSLPNNLDEDEGIEELDVSGTAITSIPSCIVGLKQLSKLYVDGCNGSSSNSL
ncbi:disease resistance protein RPV1-like [Prosopis cineraria]|uniref:disease resistance protein RPV1-like n=1 Tax=Prosopis cineraria TaxID=364024 RepID=UPI00240F3286|nr:disease resistance protein RPV1-like [Prosopis cineraria]